jgi:hypothetical protein
VREIIITEDNGEEPAIPPTPFPMEIDTPERTPELTFSDSDSDSDKDETEKDEDEEEEEQEEKEKEDDEEDDMDEDDDDNINIPRAIFSDDDNYSDDSNHSSVHINLPFGDAPSRTPSPMPHFFMAKLLEDTDPFGGYGVASDSDDSLGPEGGDKLNFVDSAKKKRVRAIISDDEEEEVEESSGKMKKLANMLLKDKSNPYFFGEDSD